MGKRESIVSTRKCVYWSERLFLEGMRIETRSYAVFFGMKIFRTEEEGEDGIKVRGLNLFT